MNRTWDQVVGLGDWDTVAQGFTWDRLLLADTLPEPKPPEPPKPLPPGELHPDLRTGNDLYRGTQPIAFSDPDTDGAWWLFTEALSGLLDPIAEITRPTPWLALANPWACPRAWLNVLAQWAGIRRPDAFSEEDLRILIGEGGPGFWRGTRANMIAMIRRFLPPGTPDNFVYFEERADGDPYRLRIFTYSVDTPPDVEVQIRDALNAAKPAGLYPFEYQVRVGQTWRMLRDRQLGDNVGGLLSTEDSTFDGGTVGHWIGEGCDLTVEDGALKATKVGEAGEMSAALAAGIPVQSGQQYTVGAQLRAAAEPKPVTVGLRWRDGGGGQLHQDYELGHSEGPDWVQLTLTATAPAEAVTVEPFVFWYYGRPVGEAHYVDDVTLRLATEPSPHATWGQVKTHYANWYEVLHDEPLGVK